MFQKVLPWLVHQKLLCIPKHLPSPIPRRFLKQHVKRFYRSVSITQSDGQFEINLDRKKLKTPLGKLLRLPTEPLALAVASEWDSQKGDIIPQNMYLSTLCNTATDNPLQRSKDDIAEQLLRYLDTDTVCFWMDEPPELMELQRRSWGPVIEWVMKRHNVEIGVSSDIAGVTVPALTKEILGRHLRSYNLWSLIGFQHAAESLKSMILTLALIDRHLSVNTAVALSRLEEEFQIAHWGNVEWAHDLELMHLQASVAASVLFVHFTTESDVVDKKIGL